MLFLLFCSSVFSTNEVRPVTPPVQSTIGNADHLGAITPPREIFPLVFQSKGGYGIRLCCKNSEEEAELKMHACNFLGRVYEELAFRERIKNQQDNCSVSV